MKIPFSLGANYLIKLIAPSFILSLSCIPIFKVLISILNINVSTEMVFFIFIFVFSCMFIGLDDPIYMFIEGRRYWPNGLKEQRIKRHAIRLQKLNAKMQKYIDLGGKKHKLQKHDVSYLKYLEISAELDRFPVDENGEYCVQYPTRIGNLLIAYEDYPFRIYGMDASFYFYRIWLMIDDSVRKEINGVRSIADSMVYCFMALSISSILCFFYAGIAIFQFKLMSFLPMPIVLYVLFIILLLLVLLSYNLALFAHHKYGELFKAVFDLYRKTVPLDDILIDTYMDDGNKEGLEKYSFKKKSKQVLNILKIYKHLKHR